MFRKKINTVLFILMITGSAFHASAQTEVNEKDFSVLNDQPLREKIFVHTDKNFYVAGEILWFKLYDVSADSLKPLDLSNVAYVEILNANQKPVLQATVPLNSGTGNGSFYLASSIASGNYIFRAYTNWMKNFDAGLYFQKTITIVNTLTQVTKPANKDSDRYEIGFFPEGGELVENIQSKVGFKVTNKYGNGINCTGNIVDEKNNSIADFSTFKFGMGSFYFTPGQDHTYTAVVKINGKNFSSALPAAMNTGYVMHLSGSNEDKMVVDLKSNTDQHKPVYLVAYSNKNVKAALMQTTDGDGKTAFSLNKNDLSAGVTHFVVFNNNKQAVCERLLFLKPQSFPINLSADKDLYETRSEVKLNIASKDNADLSMAVYLADSLQGFDDDNILNYLWLSSELKGKIESPQYYFNNTGSEADSALDNLLLTQGWSRFNQEDNGRPSFRFAPEHEGHIIEGWVTDKISGLPAAHVRVYLSVPGQHFRFTSSVSNDTGHVFFDVKDFYGSGEVILQTAKEDSMYRADISDPFSNEPGSLHPAPLNLSEDQLKQLSQRNLAMQVQNAYTINQLNRFNSPALDTNAFYGIPDNKYFLDDYVRFNTMEEVLREYVTGIDVRIRQGNYYLIVPNYAEHKFFDNGPLVLIDGVPVFDMNKLIAYNPLKIKKAEVVTRKYYINSLVADGILSYSTYKGDLDGFQFDPGTIELSYEGLQLEREFYSPQYSTTEQKQTRLPDYRNILYWAPEIITKSNTQISFYTSDVKGKYVVVIQGIDRDGQAGFGIAGFEVK